MSQIQLKQIALPEGSLVVGNASDNASELPIGTALQVLRVNAGGTALEFATPSAMAPYQAATNPTANNDDVDTAAIGRTFAVGDFWINTSNLAVYIATSVATGAAVWDRLDTFTIEVTNTYSGSQQTGSYEYTGFFASAVTVIDDVFINGLRVRRSDVSITGSGLNLTLDMAAIGYPLDTGDVITAKVLQ